MKNLFRKVLNATQLGLASLAFGAVLKSEPARANPVTNIYNGVTSTNITLNNDTDLTWLYAKDYKIQVYSLGNGNISGNTNDGWIAQGEKLNLAASASQGYIFAYFSVNNGTSSSNTANNPLEIIVNEPLTLTATFLQEPEFALYITNRISETNQQTEVTLKPTSSDWQYGIDSKTDLNDTNSWNEVLRYTRGNDSDIVYTNIDNRAIQFYRGKAKPYVP